MPDPTSLDRLGNLHLVLLHLPIGLLAAVIVAEVALRAADSPAGRQLLHLVLGANAAAALATAAFGLLLARSGSYDAAELSLHRWSGLATTALAAVGWTLHRRWVLARLDAGLPPRLRAWRTFLATLAAGTVATGHFGGVLTHGPDALAFWRSPSVTAVAAPPVGDEAAIARFSRDILPVLERSCLECHGPAKSKGRLRLDVRSAALAGGKGGTPAIVPGNPEASEMIRRLRLPRADDRAMPPDDADALPPDQIARLEQWIRDGAEGW